jgi:hypothetical protein
MCPFLLSADTPYFTDGPNTVDYKHLGFYIASQSQFTRYIQKILRCRILKLILKVQKPSRLIFLINLLSELEIKNKVNYFIIPFS